MDTARLDAGTGLVGSALSFVGGVMMLSALPKVDDPVATYLSFAVDKRGQILTGLVLFSIGGGLLVCWAAALRRHLAGATTGHLPDVMLAGAVWAYSVGFAAVAPLAAVAWRGPGALDGNVVRLLVDMVSVGFAVLSAVPFFVFVLAGALAMLRTGQFPAWAGWLGVVAAAVNGAFVFTLFARRGVFSPYSPIGFVGAVLYFVWVGASSVRMSRPADRRSRVLTGSLSAAS